MNRSSTETSSERFAGEPSVRDQRRSGRRNTILLIASLVAIVAAEAAYFFLVYVPDERAQAQEAWKERLSGIANDREAALESWVRERVADAHLVASYPSLTKMAGAAASGAQLATGEQATRAHVTELLDEVVKIYRYQSAYVVDGHGGVLVQATGSPAIEDIEPATAQQALATSSAAIDFRLKRDGLPVIVIVAPILTDNAGSTAARAPPGAVVLVADPNDWMYPLLRSEPVPTASAETLLVRREGKSLLYLSPLRHANAPPLTFTRPINVAGFAARSAIEGRPGFSRYRDYRGKPVFAATRMIAGTPWGFLVKVDEAEVLTPATAEATRMGLSIAVMTTALAIAAFIFIRSRRSRSEVTLARSETRFSQLFENANDAVVMSGLDGRIVGANRKAEALYGYARSELIGLPVRSLRPEETWLEIPAQMQDAQGAEGLLFETIHLAKDGSGIPVEVSSRGVETADGTVFLSIVRDVRERKAAEERIRLLNRLLRTISEINQLVIREHDRDRLLSDACRILVEHGGFIMAWIGFAEPETGRVRPVASAGFTDGYLEAVDVRFDDSERGRGPTGTAIRERRPVVVNDWESDASMAPWRALGLARGYRASAAFPLEVGRQVPGAVAVYADRAGFFSEEVVSLLVDSAGNLASGLNAMEVQAQRNAAQEALRESKEKLRAFFDSSVIGTLLGDVHGAIVEANDELLRIVGYSRDDLRAGRLRWIDITPPEYFPLDERGLAEARERGACTPYEKEYIRKDGSRVWVLVGYILTGPTRESSVAFILDISERKRSTAERERAEGALLGSVERLESLFQNMQEAFAYCRMLFADGRPQDYIYLKINRAFETLTGLKNVEGKRVSEVIPGILESDPELIESFGRVASTGNAEKFEIYLNSMKMWFSISVYRPEPECFAAVFDVITERKRAEQQIALLNASLEDRVAKRTTDLEAANRELEAFSYSVSHDLRAPLRAIDGFSQTVDEEYGPRLDDEGRRLLRVIRDNTRKMAQLIDDLLTFSRIARRELQPLRINMSEMARNVFSELVPEGARGRYDFGCGQLPDTVGDATMLRQLWTNLLSNAVKFTGPTDQPAISISGGREGNEAIYHVRDNGVGFDMQYADKLFGAFQRLHSARDFEGTGVGLALVQRIVHRHGGRVWAEGKVGQGATLSFALPAPGDES